MCRHESRPLVGKCPLVKVQPPIPVLQVCLAGYFNQVVFWETMASMSAKPTQFSFLLCHSFPCFLPYLASSYIATNYALNIQFTRFSQPGVVCRTCTKVLLNSVTVIIHTCLCITARAPFVIPPNLSSAGDRKFSSRSFTGVTSPPARAWKYLQRGRGKTDTLDGGLL